MDVETLARHAAAIGLSALENVPPKDWPILKRYGLVNAMTVGHGFVDGMNHKENHAMCVAKLTEAIEATGAAGFPNVITFSGNRCGMSDEVGLENTVLGLKRVIGLAERKKVNLCLEVLNSRVHATMKGHPDYMCDKVEWAAEVCKRMDSPRMKILFDIYHVQVMQGDLITRIRQYHPYIGHYHLAGVPGRGELDDRQEVNYPAVLRAILATGYTGYVGQEFMPTRDPIQSLREAARICDV
jgi:hydroxypyruvate isomerase